MTRKAVVICPGRGTYNKTELGYLARHHSDKTALMNSFDALRNAAGQEPITTLDSAEKYSVAKHTRGDIASPLIFASGVGDARSLMDDIDVVAVTGNSMGWYTTLAVAGAVSAADGFNLCNTMGHLMQENLIGGQLIYPFVGDDWHGDIAHKSALLAKVADIDSANNQTLRLSIDLGGMLVLAGDEAGLTAFESAVPNIGGRFPMRLQNHAAFHTDLQEPVSNMGRVQIPISMFNRPNIPMIDGRGHIWWPHSSDANDLWNYTLGYQVTQTYDFTTAIQTAARAFAPDVFVIVGPGTTLGGAVAQSLILADWDGMKLKSDFQARQSENPLLISMGIDSQRPIVAKG